jgi:AmmeMemoRadiSam system protein B
VAPHHLIDGLELGAFWAGIAALRPEVVVVVGPDHEGRGPGISLPRGIAWETAFGELRPDRGLADALLRALAGTAEEIDAPFVGEHSIYAHVPYLRSLLPEARFLPIIVHGLGAAGASRLSRALDALLPERAIVVASVDFSHFQPERWADFHDEASAAVLEALAIDGLYNVEVDSPDSLACAISFASARGARRALPLLRTNSQEKRSVFVPDTTSHLYYAFAPGPCRAEPSLSVMAIGADSPIGDSLAPAALGPAEGCILAEWRWRGAGEPSRARSLVSGRVIEIAADDPDLSLLRSPEDRFFVGADLVLFGLEPGTKVEASIRRGGLEFRVAAASVRARDAAGLGDRVEELRDGAAFLVLVIDWEGKTPDLELARAALRAGASLVVGRNGGPPTGPIEEGGRLAFPSLGSFGRGPGSVLGVTLYGDRSSWRLMPLDPESERPRLDMNALAAASDLPVAAEAADERE